MLQKSSIPQTEHASESHEIKRYHWQFNLSISANSHSLGMSLQKSQKSSDMFRYRHVIIDNPSILTLKISHLWLRKTWQIAIAGITFPVKMKHFISNCCRKCRLFVVGKHVENNLQCLYANPVPNSLYFQFLRWKLLQNISHYILTWSYNFWCVCLPNKTVAKTVTWLITTFIPAFVSGLVPSLAMAPALGPYFCVRYWIRGTPLSGVAGFRKNGFHVTSKSKSLENTFMASSRWRFPTKHLK